jgi:hypothetical protein
MAFSDRRWPPATSTGLTALFRKAAAASTAAFRLSWLLTWKRSELWSLFLLRVKGQIQQVRSSVQLLHTCA